MCHKPLFANVRSHQQGLQLLRLSYIPCLIVILLL